MLVLGRLPSHMIMHIISDSPRFRCRRMHSGTRARPGAVQFSRKADYEKRRSYFSIFASLLRVMHAGQPSNLSTLLQSQTKSGLCARSFTVCVCSVKVHPSAQCSVQYICARLSALWKCHGCTDVCMCTATCMVVAPVNAPTVHEGSMQTCK